MFVDYGSVMAIRGVAAVSVRYGWRTVGYGTVSTIVVNRRSFSKEEISPSWQGPA